MINWADLQPLPLRRQRDMRDRERLADAALAKKRAKHNGRNHWRNWERRQMLLAKRRDAKLKAEKRKADHKRHIDRVRAFWCGLAEEHP